MTVDQRQKLRIAIGFVVGFIVGVLVIVLIFRDSYNWLGSMCWSAFAVPFCAFVGAFIGGFWKDKA